MSTIHFRFGRSHTNFINRSTNEFLLNLVVENSLDILLLDHVSFSEEIEESFSRLRIDGLLDNLPPHELSIYHYNLAHFSVFESLFFTVSALLIHQLFGHSILLLQSFWANLVKDVRGEGSIFHIEFQANKARSSNSRDQSNATPGQSGSQLIKEE
jgi:hypothetical protein